jgi:hypothetical protein
MEAKVDLRASAARTLSLSFLLAAAGCAGDKFGARTQTWNEVGDSDYDDARSAKAREKKLTAREYAARFPTGAECEMEARRTLSLDERGGVALFAACLERSDFRLLEPFYAAPWKVHLSDAEDATDLARVIAQRGGWVGEDLAFLQQQDVDIYSLAQAVETPDQARGKPLIARLRFLAPREGVPGQLVFEEATLSPDDVEVEEEAPTTNARYPTTLTGQRVLLELPERKKPLRAGDEIVVVGELLGIERVLNKETVEEEDWAVVLVKGHFVPEVRTRD